jgi:archaellum component FlaC
VHNKDNYPDLKLDIKNLITDFNKYREEKLKVVESEVKQLARNFKSLATRVEQSINKIKQKAGGVLPHSILNHH